MILEVNFTPGCMIPLIGITIQIIIPNKIAKTGPPTIGNKLPR